MMRNVASVARSMSHWLVWRFWYSARDRRHAHVGPARLWQMKREFQIGFLRRMGLESRHRLLDLGCGTLRGGIPIIDYLDTGHYFGVEARGEVLAEGRAELQESGLLVKKPTLIHHADLAVLQVGEEFDYVWAFSVLIHMSDAVLDDALGFVRGHLEADGAFYGNVNVGDRPDGAWRGFPIVHRSMRFYEEACRRHGLRVEELGPLTDFGHHLPGKSIHEQAGKRMLKIWKA